MKYLLDTHAAKWALDDATKFSLTTGALIEDSSSPLYISIASVWEVAIKTSIGKLDFAGGSSGFWEDLKQLGVILLPVELSHINYTENLPLYHRDPFDRIIIATALAEKLTIITADTNIQKYDVPWIW
ncbi:MAG: type II toxin-antitoxin system VapC family toxin [Defluviitaleaceae bacterium]|nr:type II toxin-antitoxin system VapC family toxin [Defluviitaleaceae bacterium]